jgi:hypothetical protein
LYQCPAQKREFQSLQWLKEHRRAVAGLLTEEEDIGRLSRQEVTESTQYHLSYYQDDLVVIDWDASLVIGEKAHIDDILHVMELANVQLLELGVYDRMLDTAVHQAYRDVSDRGRHMRHKVHHDLREIRMDMARLNDELLNITKFFGDWHLARIYQHVSHRFHLTDWHHITDEKLKTLAHLYQLLQQDRINLYMVLLEAAIVLLFIIDLAILFIHR